MASCLRTLCEAKQACCSSNPESKHVCFPKRCQTTLIKRTFKPRLLCGDYLGMNVTIVLSWNLEDWFPVSMLCSFRDTI